MTPYFGATNDKGQWWNGKDWKKYNDANPADVIQRTLWCMEFQRQDEEAGRHPDGVFTCPRCRMMHFLIDTFDYLCDGCISVLRLHPNTSALVHAGLVKWDELRKNPWAPEIRARLDERDVLHAEFTRRRYVEGVLQLVPPLSTPKGRDYMGALPKVTKELQGQRRAVGFHVAYSVYRANWDDRKGDGAWSWQSTVHVENYTESKGRS